MKIQDAKLDDVLQHVRDRFNSDLPNYSDCIRHAFSQVDAVFWREKYLEFYWQCVTTVPGYIQQVIVANADAESAGSLGLYDLWKSVSLSEQLDHGLEKHFQDESRHSRLFIHLADLSFPGFFDAQHVEALKSGLFNSSEAPRIKSLDSVSLPVVLDNLVQMNLGEIRTRAHMFMIAPVLTAMAPEENCEHVDGILGGLIYDEVSHIGYTACLMEEFCANGHKDLIAALYLRRLRDFNSYTVEQTRHSVDLYGRGAFPELLEV